MHEQGRPIIKKWYTEIEYYNENGEKITKSEAEREYIIFGKTINTKINGEFGTKTIWYECRRNQQLKIF